jgi:threonine dehydrogenase-like Zn-dependent dehydrogenase
MERRWVYESPGSNTVRARISAYHRCASPSIEEIAGSGGVLVKMLAAGVCGTDRSIYSGQYGEAPEGSDFLVIGHENFGQVQSIGANVWSRPSKPLTNRATTSH